MKISSDKRKGPLRVLTIDDDDEYNFLTQDTFESSGLDFELTFKLSASEALDYLAAVDHFPDLILLDINMPVMNGWDFLKEYEVRRYHEQRGAVIVVTSSSVYAQDNEKARSHVSVADYVEKPLTVGHLLDFATRFNPQA